jgi:hypothetical protein
MRRTGEHQDACPEAIDTMRDAVGLLSAVWRGDRTDVMVLYEPHRDDPSRLVGALGVLASTLLEGLAAAMDEDPEAMLRNVSLALCGGGG